MDNIIGYVIITIFGMTAFMLGIVLREIISRICGEEEEIDEDMVTDYERGFEAGYCAAHKYTGSSSMDEKEV